MVGIIGCGASGMIAAIMAAREGCKVTVLEHNDRPGRKLLATGNGRCNLTNEDQSEENFRTNEPGIAKKILRQFTKDDILSFFGGIGILTHCRRGYWYPRSDQASAVVTALSEEMKRLGVQVLYGAEVTKVSRGTAEEAFSVKASVQGEAKEFSFERLLIACGGSAGDHLGQSDFGFRVLRSLGVPVMRYRPALVPLELRGHDGRLIAGTRMDAAVTLQGCGDEFPTSSLTETGEIVWTDYGISGIPVMQLSRYAALALDAGREVLLSICMVPSVGNEKLRDMVLARAYDPVFSSRNAAEALCGFVPDKVSAWLIKRADIDPTARITDISEDRLYRYAEELGEVVFPVKGLRSYAQAQTTCGGVSLTEINPDTMEVLSVSGLYVTGELLDVDGACGGYNLQWAFATGAVAGRALARR